MYVFKRLNEIVKKQRETETETERETDRDRENKLICAVYSLEY